MRVCPGLARNRTSLDGKGVIDMSNDGNKAIVPPAWLSEALEGDVVDDVLNKRSEHRHVWARLASVEEHGSAKPRFSAKIMNASPHGLGLTCRQTLCEGDQLTLTPDGVADDGTPYDPINVRVVYCTSTIQGFKVGCVFV